MSLLISLNENQLQLFEKLENVRDEIGELADIAHNPAIAEDFEALIEDQNQLFMAISFSVQSTVNKARASDYHIADLNYDIVNFRLSRLVSHLTEERDVSLSRGNYAKAASLDSESAGVQRVALLLKNGDFHNDKNILNDECNI